MIDALWPEDALTAEAEARLVNELTDILIAAEGYDPSNPIARSVTVLNLHRPAAVFVGGERSKAARYRSFLRRPRGNTLMKSAASW
jgi:hypothetical protein